jgi:Sugar (and other) transporter
MSIKVAPIIIRDLPNGRLFFVYAGMLTFYFVWIFISLPETKGLALEDMGLAFATWKRWKPVIVPDSPPRSVETLNEETPEASDSERRKMAKI